jgi:hypothetical protein
MPNSHNSFRFMQRINTMCSDLPALFIERIIIHITESRNLVIGVIHYNVQYMASLLHRIKNQTATA